MSITLGTLRRRLHRLGHGEITRQVRRELDEPLPQVRARVKISARTKLPATGGLAEWAAAAHVTAQVYGGGSTVTAHLRVHRTSLYKPSDLRALDRGRVRHPAWGRRAPSDWSVQLVPGKVYTEPITEAPEWLAAVERACQRAAGVVEHG